jgi:hypothetical protein
MMNIDAKYAKAITSSTLQRGKCSIAYGAYYIPSLEYDTQSSSLTYKECEGIQRPMVAEILPKMGIVRNAVRTVAFGPSQYCDMAIGQLAAVHGYTMIQYLLGHLRSKSPPKKKSYPETHTEPARVHPAGGGMRGKSTGTPQHDRYTSLITRPHWVTATWEYLYTCKVSIDVTSQWTPWKSRLNGITIMEALTDSQAGYAPKELRILNR